MPFDVLCKSDTTLNKKWSTHLHDSKHGETGYDGEGVVRVTSGQVSEPEQASRLHALNGQGGHATQPNEERDEDRSLVEKNGVTT